ncbi:hypothetical protein D9M71_599940 [compost metagenome]
MAAQAFGQELAEHPEQAEDTRPHRRQQQEIPRHAPARTGRWTIDQLIHLVGRTVRAQAPGVEQVLVEVELVLDVIDARTDGAQQPALYQGFRVCRRCGGGGRCRHPRYRRGLQFLAAEKQQRSQQYRRLEPDQGIRSFG